MSYRETKEIKEKSKKRADSIMYQILPNESFLIQRNCAGCGKSNVFFNTDCFRVNANGNKIDVWLIYQCKDCKHTYNLTVYERQKPESISKTEYEKFLENNRETSFYYGTNVSFFAKNKASILWNDISYRIEEQKKEEKKEKEIEGNLRAERSSVLEEENRDRGIHETKSFRKIEIKNPYGLKLRTDKIITEVLGISRPQLKKYRESDRIEMEEDKQKHIIRIYVKDFDF